MQNHRNNTARARSSYPTLTAAGAVLLAIALGCADQFSEPSVRVQAGVAESSLVAAALSSTNVVADEKTGTLKGRIVFDGDRPNLKPLVAKGAMVKDAQVCAAEEVPDESLVVGEDGGIANVFVYLPKAPKGIKIPEPEETEVEFDQKNCAFIPHALVVQTGQTVKLLSGDPIAHNTHTYPLRNDGFNSVVAAGDREGKLTITYRRAEPLPTKVKCDYHPHMEAYHLVLDHPFAVATDKNGEFTIEGLPPGKHEFRLWQERAGYLERSYDVEIKAGETTEVELKFKPSKFDL